MSRLTQKPAVLGLDLFQSTTDTAFSTMIGEKAVSSDGREFVLVYVGGSNIAAGLLCQAPAIVANHQNIAVAAAAAAGATSVTVTLGATAATANQYAGGYLVVNDATGEGQTLRIASHPAANLSTALIVTLEDAVVTALTTSSEVCLIANPYNGIIVSPTTQTGVPVGVTLYAVTASTYAWIQTKGPVACLNNAGTAVGLGLAPSATTAGALDTVAATTTQVATALQAGVSTEYRTVSVLL